MARKTGSHSEITGPRIRAAALQLFARHGFAAVSMRQIAGEVGVQAGALYLYTPDKQTLLFDLLEAHMVELLDSWSKSEAGGDPVQNLEAFCRCHIQFNLSHSDSLFISYMELRNLDPDNFAKIEAYRKRYEDALEAILKAGTEAKLFSLPDTKLATMAVIAMLNGVNTWFREGGRLSQDRVERIYWNMVRRAVGAKGFS
ncbi:Transcriptional regulator, TetR family [Candidatus Rhodobacter oscarellae]|uniref:Transcriptional regulator, TetR family n=1 Tax=Candidatus Rhodobacter oscarellae TaxID=1675527 RepID=A0A0J9E5F5_9RHOB|nr:TetR/AcrR family transcriptional regulator [Candidatus Rhodobacter lobularis]KMW58000.1 Transcriptional regulator, TetR family [Candidatus Rhodobacter lobularis]